MTANNILFTQIGICSLTAQIEIGGIIIEKISDEFQILADMNAFPSQVAFDTQPTNTVSTQSINAVTLRL